MIEVGEGKYKVWLLSLKMGDDFLVIIGGGEKPHLGGFSLCINGSPISVSLPNHKDYLISHEAAEKIHKKINRNVIVICGIHIDRATDDDIKKLIENSRECINRFLINPSSACIDCVPLLKDPKLYQ
ncbi:MAG: hypothetical protein N3D72_00805 [Candidatus Methanomethyliaceae archaeon]|nr:hypothetical protein [Candidatus Methanomethyliaceae archaeon]